jgi:hypothetical protein
MTESTDWLSRCDRPLLQSGRFVATGSGATTDQERLRSGESADDKRQQKCRIRVTLEGPLICPLRFGPALLLVISQSPSEGLCERPVSERLTMILEKARLLDHVLLGNNPSPTAKTGWSKLSGRVYDLVTWDYGPSDWSVTCNLKNVGPGTVGWIYRSDGSFGYIAGLIVFSSTPQPQQEAKGVVHYCEGLLWRLPREYWIDVARVSAHKAGWSGRSPFKTVKRFANGEQLKTPDKLILWDLLHPVAQAWISSEVSRQRPVSIRRPLPRKRLTVQPAPTGIAKRAS